MIAQSEQSVLGTDNAAVAVFDNHDFTEAAVKRLARSDFEITNVTVVGRGVQALVI